jgi:hypothetical protein
MVPAAKRAAIESESTPISERTSLATSRKAVTRRHIWDSPPRHIGFKATERDHADAWGSFTHQRWAVRYRPRPPMFGQVSGATWQSVATPTVCQECANTPAVCPHCVYRGLSRPVGAPSLMGHQHRSGREGHRACGRVRASPAPGAQHPLSHWTIRSVRRCRCRRPSAQPDSDELKDWGPQ